ncbi:MAG TPA: dextranase, partial [Enterococcus sp.]|nr:dextranase [Enterococcus sp.]
MSVALTIVVVFGVIGMIGMSKEKQGNISIDNVSANKSMYQPGEKVNVTISLRDEAKKNQGFYELVVTHLGEIVAQQTDAWQTINGRGELKIEWEPPHTDFKGYLLQIKVNNEAGKTITQTNKAIDVSSTWTKFPRYGYLTNFDKDIDTKAIIEQMSQWQLNGIEYYDWKYLHHQLIPEDGSMEWQDWAGRIISGETVKRYIADARAKGMTNMSYNMIYAATNNYAQ